jgi:hypothetical protein
MIDIHSSFLKPFFREMNKRFPDQWCVLHSYENLPYYSLSDVDMAFSSNKLKSLENLIYNVAFDNEWEVIQRLWYDIEYCYYYVLWQKENDVFLAIDFLIDNNGIGRYGFSSFLLTKNCMKFKGLIEIPNHEVAFLYKFSKRLIKNRDISKDFVYLLNHYSQSNKDRLYSMLVNKFGDKNSKKIQKEFIKRNFDIGEINRVNLLNYTNSFKLNKYLFKIKRLLSRVIFPCGLIIYVPIAEEKDLVIFKSLLKEKMSLAFRSILINDSFFSIFKNIFGLSGNSLVICKCSSNSKIIWSWGKKKKMLDSKLLKNDLNSMSEFYKQEIIKILAERMDKRRIL